MKHFMVALFCAALSAVAVAVEIPHGRIVRTVETNGVTAVYFELTPEATSYIRGIVALPAPEKWNGRLKGFGGGGPANYLDEKGPIRAAMQGWAAAYSDLGSSRGVSTPAQIRDYGHRATHLACTTAKALVLEKYGRPAHHAYFVGGSTGGGQGFHEVLRYPADYDGVISMVPANTRLPLHVYFAWNLRLMTDADGKPVFSDAELQAVEEAAIDVFRDRDAPWARGRFLSDSRYDPETEKAILKRAVERAPTLDRPDLLDRLHKLFTGPVLEGRRIHSGVPFSASFRKAAGNQWMLQWYLPKGRPLHTVTDADLLDWLKTWGPDCNACDPDISAFAARGGKLLVWAGLEDSICPYPALMDWHDAAARKVGRETLDACCRMYLLPGLAHGRGRGLGGVDDAERLIVDWVEKGVRPEVVTGSLRDGEKIPLKPYPACFEKSMADETASIQARIDAASRRGGGVVSVPAGDHAVVSLELKSGVTLRLEKGARLVASTNMSDYASIPASHGQRAVVWAKDAVDVALEGEGVVDGRGWSVAHLGEAPGRWKCCVFFRSRNVRIQDVTLTNPATWTCYLKECDGVHVKGVKIRSLTNWNNDGIDIDSKNVLVEDCDIDSDDDAICPKSDNPDFICENVEVRNCRLASNCNHIKLGTASRGGFRNIWIHDCELVPCATNIIPQIKNGIGRGNDIPGWDKREIGSRCGIAVECVDGGILENVRVSDIRLNRCCQTPVFVRLGRRREHPGKKASLLRNVTVENVRGESMSYLASSVTGVPGLRVQDVTIRNVDLVVKGGGPADEVSRPVPEAENKYPENRMFGRKMLPAYGFYVRHADGVTFENVRLSYTGDTEGRPAVFADDASPTFVNCAFRKPQGANPATMEKRP